MEILVNKNNIDSVGVISMYKSMLKINSLESLTISLSGNNIGEVGG